MLREVKYLDYDATYTYAPPQKMAVVNTEQIAAVLPGGDHRGEGPFIKLVLACGKELICRGRPDDFIPAPGKPDFCATPAQLNLLREMRRSSTGTIEQQEALENVIGELMWRREQSRREGGGR